MPLLTTTGLGKSFGPVDLFKDITLSIPHRARIGLVGVNGVGKTTLLRILVGLEEASEGSVGVAKGTRVGYLPQRPNLDTPRTIWEECQTSFSDLIEMQTELRRMEHEMSAQPDSTELIEAYGRLQSRFEHRGGYTYEARIRQTLTGLGFPPSDYSRPLNLASGGQQTRAFLARLLLSDPDLLLLDEPTNHLDIEAIEWLESYLREWNGGVLIVSHDRYFLDQVVQDIWEMTPSLELYHGNYSAYLQQREERYRRRMEEYEAQQAFVEKESDYIRRNLAGQNTNQAKGRRTRLERLLETAQAAPPVQSRSLRLRLAPVTRSGDLVLRTHALGVGYQDEKRVLFRVADLTLRRGECAAVIGPNGAGKTTFLKTVLGQIPPLLGEVQLGASLEVGYFAQAHEGLRPERSLMDEIEAAAPQMRPGEIRDYLAKFLFTGEDVFKKVRLLSGGERGRLALAILALSSANLLLLDEPTNHLDLPSQEVLQAVLSAYAGTILLVSHDRYLIDGLATQVWEVLPDQGKLRVFEGTYSQYKQVLAAEETARLAARQVEAQASQRAEPQAHSDQPQAPRRAGRSNNRERERLERIRQIEEEINTLENRLAAVGRALENPPADPGKVQELGQEYVRLQREHEELFSEWSELTE